MPPQKTSRRTGPKAGVSKKSRGTVEQAAAAVVTSLEGLASTRYRDDMGKRYGIVGASADTAFGVPMSAMQKVAKELIRARGLDHALAAALWEWDGPGRYEARLMATFVDDPDLVTAAQMDRWAKDFDNWGICDTVCFKLFDRVGPALAFRKVEQWAKREREEFVKRAAFALLASLALHDKVSGDEPFERCLPLIERAATDDRNFVKKGVSWALRAVGKRNAALNAAAVEVAQRLADSPRAAARWVGKDALRDLTKRSSQRR